MSQTPQLGKRAAMTAKAAVPASSSPQEDETIGRKYPPSNGSGGRRLSHFRAFASPPSVARAARSSQLCSEGQPTTNAAAAAYRSTAHRAAGCTQRGAFTPGGRRTRGDLDDEARHSLLARHVVTDAHSSPLRVGPRHSRPSCPRGSRPRSERPRLAMQARRRGRVFGVRAPALPLSAARPRCRPPARSARNRAAPCRCR